ncbi:MAG: FABP family protein [Acidobacteria bacterium]|nr:FABP family protein [Acidobacteriota bacterium]
MKILAALGFVLVSSLAFAQEPSPTPAPDPWALLRRLEGTWRGTGAGEPGTSTVERTYAFVLRGKFLEARQKSTYAPQEKNPKGELHEDLGYFSWDKKRKLLVFRQFHVEGFVNQYVAEVPAAGDSIVFTTEAIENLPVNWRARETLRFSGDELTEVFELSAPGKEFSIYSETRLKRIKP